MSPAPISIPPARDLGVNGKAITVAGEGSCLLVGVDHETQDIDHSLVCEKEEGGQFVRLVMEARLNADYLLKGWSRTMDRVSCSLHRTRFPQTPDKRT